MRSIFVCLFWALIVSPQSVLALSDTLSSQEFEETLFSEEDPKTLEVDLPASDEQENEEEQSVLDPPRTIGTERWNKVKQDRDFIYRYEKPEIKPKIEKASERRPPLLVRIFSSEVFKVILSILAIGLVLFIIYKIFENGQFNYFKRHKQPVINAEDSNVNHSNSEDLEAQLHLALQKNDFRTAVNLMYRQTIQQLHTQQLIELEPDKSNWAYVQEYEKHRSNKEFAELTRYFDYIWYGSFPLTEEAFVKIRNSFSNFQISLNG